MAKGIKLPLTAKNGRLVLATGDAYIEQLIYTGLGSGDSDNPFQDLGLGEFMIFDINDQIPEGEIKRRVEAVFDVLNRDQLAMLEAIEFQIDGADKKMNLGYRNLETGKREDLEVPILPQD